jgi:hypothetical protein
MSYDVSVSEDGVLSLSFKEHYVDNMYWCTDFDITFEMLPSFMNMFGDIVFDNKLSISEVCLFVDEFKKCNYP